MRWPSEFTELLTNRGREILDQGLVAPQFEFDNGETPYVSLRDVVDSEQARVCLAAFESRFAAIRPYRVDYRIPGASQARPELDYSSSPFCARHYQMTCPMDGYDPRYDEAGLRNSRSFFDDSGLRTFAQSDSIRRFAEKVTGYELRQREGSGILVVCYGAYDYLSPHTDVSWPFTAGWDSENRAIAYVDFHLIFGNDAVAHQYIVMQDGAHLNKILGGPPFNGAISVYRLPLWHYSTPLVPKPGREDEARRWILMLNYQIVGDDRPKLLCE